MESIIDQFTVAVDQFAATVWNVMVPVLFGIGLYLTVRNRFVQFRKLGAALKLVFSKSARSGGGEGDVSPFAALSTALAATVGNGNIAGVATAIFWGGPGAIFWMWVCGVLGMATKYSEAVLGVRFREKHPDGTIAGGPMYYIRAGLNNSGFSKFLAAAFAVCGGIAAFGIGNMVQSNQMTLAFHSEFGVPPIVSAITITLLVALVILGGIKRIGAVTSRLVPGMVLLYVGVGSIVLLLNITNVPAAFVLIFEHAFSPAAASGGFLGAAVSQAIQFGARRGIFSNEAGLGSAPIAHAAARAPSPQYQGFIGIAEVFIDTILICTFTALILLSSGMWTSGLEGAAMTARAFGDAIPGVGGLVVATASFLFGYSTLIGWSYYGEQCWKYLFGWKIGVPYRIVFLALTFIGALSSIQFVFFLSDVANAFMALPNLIGLTLLSGLVAKSTREALERAHL